MTTPDVEVLTAEELRVVADRRCNASFGFGLPEFLEKWESGELHWGHDHPDHTKIVHIAMLLGLKESE